MGYDESMTQQIATAQMIETLESFLEAFKEYVKAISDSGKPLRVTGPRDRQVVSPEAMLSQLRRKEPVVTDILLRVIAHHPVLSVSSRGGLVKVSLRDILPNMLLGGTTNLRDFGGHAVACIEKGIGTLESPLWPPKTPTPVLVIHDAELRQRCEDLLRAPSNYDRVVREATTVLENRIRQRPPFEVLAKVIPNSADQTGENLVNRLFNPDNPVLSISSDRTRRIAFRNILVGVVSYLRNPSHHQLDDATGWSWAWSTVGLIDHLLAVIDSCTVQTP